MYILFHDGSHCTVHSVSVPQETLTCFTSFPQDGQLAVEHTALYCVQQPHGAHFFFFSRSNLLFVCAVYMQLKYMSGDYGTTVPQLHIYARFIVLQTFKTPAVEVEFSSSPQSTVVEEHLWIISSRQETVQLIFSHC